MCGVYHISSVLETEPKMWAYPSAIYIDYTGVDSPLWTE